MDGSGIKGNIVNDIVRLDTTMDGKINLTFGCIS